MNMKKFRNEMDKSWEPFYKKAFENRKKYIDILSRENRQLKEKLKQSDYIIREVRRNLNAIRNFQDWSLVISYCNLEKVISILSKFEEEY